jgi:hypothetical protein
MPVGASLAKASQPENELVNGDLVLASKETSLPSDLTTVASQANSKNDVSPTHDIRESEGTGRQASLEEESSAKDLVVNATDETHFVKSSGAGPTSNAFNPDAPSSTMVLLQTLSNDYKSHLDKAMIEMKDQSRQDFEKVLTVLQQESAKRSALEHRLHSQLLLQNEFMVAMELKLLRLEAKVERREAALRLQQQQQQRNHHPTTSTSNNPFSQHPSSGNNNSNNRPLPISASAFDTIDESSVELMPRINHRNISEETPPNMAVISSGASLASGVTAGSFLNDGDDDDEDGQHDHDDNSETHGADTIASDPVTREEDDELRHPSQHSSKYCSILLVQFFVKHWFFCLP